jgi:predicted permease
MDLAMAYSEDPAAEARLVPFYTRLFERLRAVPGMTDVAAATGVPLTGGWPDGLFLKLSASEAPTKMDDIRTLFQQKDKLGTGDYCAVSPGYFRAVGIPLVRGRFMDDHDRADGPHVAVISESLARAEWPGVDPIGRTIEFGNMDGDLRLLTIVGIVGDTHEAGLEQAPRPTVYVDLMQRPHSSFTVVMRSGLELSALTGAARAAVKELAPDVPPRFRTFSQIYAASLGSRRFNLTLVGVFAGTALILAIAGIYGVLAHSVAQRRREIGVRMALGASRGQVLRQVLGQGLTTVVIGVAIGAAAAIGLSRTVESLLFGVTPTDPAAFAIVIGTIVAVATLACYLPARRAMNGDPIEALRDN